MRVVISIVSLGIQSGPTMRAGRHYTAYRPSESRADDRVFRRLLSHAAKTAVAKQFYYVYDNEHRAGVAQSVEQRIRNAKVGGSIPFSGTISTDKRLSEKWFSDSLCSAAERFFKHFQKPKDQCAKGILLAAADLMHMAVSGRVSGKQR